jgi:hypothetical protein
MTLLHGISYLVPFWLENCTFSKDFLTKDCIHLFFTISGDVCRLAGINGSGSKKKITRGNCVIISLLTGPLPEHYTLIYFVPNKFSSLALNFVIFIFKSPPLPKPVTTFPNYF